MDGIHDTVEVFLCLPRPGSKKKKKKTYLQSGEVFNLQTGNIFKRYYSGENIDFHP